MNLFQYIALTALIVGPFLLFLAFISDLFNLWLFARSRRLLRRLLSRQEIPSATGILCGMLALRLGQVAFIELESGDRFEWEHKLSDNRLIQIRGSIGGIDRAYVNIWEKAKKDQCLIKIEGDEARLLNKAAYTLIQRSIAHDAAQAQYKRQTAAIDLIEGMISR